MLRCLTDHRTELKSDSCKSEVLYFEKMEVTDFRQVVCVAVGCTGWSVPKGKLVFRTFLC